MGNYLKQLSQTIRPGDRMAQYESILGASAKQQIYTCASLNTAKIDMLKLEDYLKKKDRRLDALLEKRLAEVEAGEARIPIDEAMDRIESRIRKKYLTENPDALSG